MGVHSFCLSSLTLHKLAKLREVFRSFTYRATFFWVWGSNCHSILVILFTLMAELALLVNETRSPLLCLENT